MSCLNCNDNTIITTSAGLPGSAGAAGVDGGMGGYCVEYNGSTVVNGAPATGTIRFNDATPSGVTLISMHNTNNASADVEGQLLSFINGFAYGKLYIFLQSDPSIFWSGTITAANALGSGPTGYQNFGVDYVDDNAWAFANNDDIAVCFTPAGADGTDGAAGADGANGESSGFCTTHNYRKFLTSLVTDPTPTTKIDFYTDGTANTAASAITFIMLSYDNSNGDDVSLLINSFSNGGDFGRIICYYASEPEKVWYGDITAVVDDVVNSRVFLTVTYIDNVNFLPEIDKADDIVTCFAPSGSDGGSDGYVWDDYTTTCAGITGFDLASDPDKIDILIDHICGLTTDVIAIETTALVAQDQNFDVFCSKQLQDGTGALYTSYDLLSIDLAQGLQGPYPVASYTINGLAPSFPIAISGGTLSQPGVSAGTTWCKFTTDGTNCSSTTTFDVIFTDTEGNVSTTSTISIDIGLAIPYDDNDNLVKTIWGDHNNASLAAIVAPAAGDVTASSATYRYTKIDQTLWVNADITVVYVNTPASGTFLFMGPDTSVTWSGLPVVAGIGIEGGATVWPCIVSSTAGNQFTVSFIGYTPIAADVMRLVFSGPVETSGTVALP